MIIVEIAGYLGSDAEERFTTSRKRVVVLRVATRIRQGGKDETIWWQVNIWDDRFDRMIPYLKKGSSVIITGKMEKPRTYVGKDGTTQIALSMKAEIMEFSPFGKPDRPDGASPSATHESAPTSYGAPAEPGEQETYAFAGDDLPF